MATSQHRCVFVGNIPYDATEEQLIQICEEVGPVVSFRLVIDRETGKPKGYGFCEYKDEETALSARRNLQGYEINGRQLRVDFAENDKNADRNREQGRGGPGMTSNADPQKQLGGPAILGDSALHQPIGLPLAMTAASVMAGALGGVQSGSNSLSQNGLQTQSGLGNDPLTHYLAKMSRNQLYQVMSELKVMAIQNKELARQLLLVSPQLPKALFQAQIILGMVTPQMLQMPNLQQSAGSLLHPPLRDGQHGQQIAVPYSGQPPLVPKAGQLGLPRAQDVQVSSVPQNILVNNQVPTLPLQQVPVQPQYQHPQLAQSHVLPQKPVSGQSGVSAIPPVHPQSLNAFSVRPQTATSATSPALKQQALAPLLQHPGQAGVTSLGNNTQLASNPHNSYLPRPQYSQLSLQDISMTAKKDLSRFTQGTDDATLIPRSNAYSSFPLGLSEKTSGVGDGSEPMHRPSKLARLEDGRKPSSMTSLNGSNMTASLTQVFGAGSLSANQVPNAGVQQNEKQTPQVQLPPEVESALLQQVMNLTAEQLSSLPPEQQQQVIQLQQMLR